MIHVSSLFPTYQDCSRLGVHLIEYAAACGAECGVHDYVVPSSFFGRADVTFTRCDSCVDLYKAWVVITTARGVEE